VATGGTYSDPTTSVNDFCEGFLIIFKKLCQPIDLEGYFPEKITGMLSVSRDSLILRPQ
jgi:hypothetical protein